MERIDKILANMGYGSRKEVKKLIKNNLIEVNGEKIKDPSINIDPEKDKIMVGDEIVNYRKFIYIMMNKPEGVVSATFDNYDETVIDLLEEEYQVFNPFPVGRLDKDTVGLLLITNDGELNHKLISPKWKVDKVYYAEINKEVNDEDVEAFKNGIILSDGYKCMPGKLEIIKSDENGAEVYVTIQEGKFHQVKRMFKAVGKQVFYLKRLRMHTLELDESLPLGEYRRLTNEELELLKQ